MTTWNPSMIYTHGVGGKDDFSRWPIGTGVSYTKIIRGQNIGPRLTSQASANTALNGYNGNLWAIGPVRGSTALGHPTRTFVRFGSNAASPASATFPVPNDYPIFELPRARGGPGGEVGNVILDTGFVRDFFDPKRNADGSGRDYKILRQTINVSGLLHSTVRGVRLGTSAGGGAVFQGGLMAHELDTPGFFITHAHHFAPNRRNNDTSVQIISKGFQYPIVSTDGTASSASENLGPVPYGALLAIRPQDIQTVVNKIKAVTSETAAAREAATRFAIAHCLYGAFINDGGAGYRGDVVSTISGRGAAIQRILRDPGVAWWSWFYYCENAVVGADAQINSNGSLTGSIGTPTGSATVPHGGGSPVSVVVDGVAYTGYNGAWDAGTVTPPPPPPPAEAAMPTLITAGAWPIVAVP